MVSERDSNWSLFFRSYLQIPVIESDHACLSIVKDYLRTLKSLFVIFVLPAAIPGKKAVCKVAVNT